MLAKKLPARAYLPGPLNRRHLDQRGSRITVCVWYDESEGGDNRCVR